MPVRYGHYARSAARSQLIFAFGAVPIGAIGPNEVQQWISQMAVDGYHDATMRAKRSLPKTILHGRDPAPAPPCSPPLPGPLPQPTEDAVADGRR